MPPRESRAARTRDPDAPTIHVVRNEVDPDSEFHCDALVARTPASEAVDFVAGERVSPEAVDGVVLTGSTAGVYEDHAWIPEQEALVRDLVEREVPTLGVCFGHQVVNEALGGTVEHVGTTAGLVEADLDDDPLFEGVAPVVPALHGDVVTEPGDDLELIATAPHAEVFATRHRSAPLWTVQFHPEITADHREHLRADHDWESDPHGFEDATAERVLDNFAAIVAETTASAADED